MWNLRAAQRGIVIAGCLSMAYTQLTMSPATIEFARSLGAGGLHIGLLGALPTGMLFCQFLAAIVANHLQYRRRLWMCVSIVQRMICLPIAFGPFLFPDAPSGVWIWLLIVITAVNHGLLHFATPLWLSWMGDYLPRKGLGQYWGIRHLWMQWTAAACLLGGATFLSMSGLAVGPAFSVLLVFGAVFGVADILMFVKVKEPRIRPLPELRLSAVLSGPFRHAGFRSFITYGCFWHFAAMVGAPFITLYLLAHIGMSLFQVLMLWACSWVGGALFAVRLGRLVDELGNRPVIVAATAFKSTNMIALLFLPADPAFAFWILIPVFMFDAVLNAAIAIASNGFLLKNSPAENRSMYIAAGTAIAGLVGGITSIVAGGMLSLIGERPVVMAGFTLNGFQTLFAASLVLRWVSVFFAARVHEPAGESAVQTVVQLVGATPFRFIRFPLGLYRSMFGETNDEDRADALDADVVDKNEIVAAAESAR